MRRETYFAKKGEVTKNWRIVDATDLPLGRMASDIAVVLMGKHRPEYTPHTDCGDFVIVVNSGKVGLSGAKAEKKLKTRFTGYAGGFKSETFGHVRDRKPEMLVRDAVRRMLPKNRLGRQMLKKLKIYDTDVHPHAAQAPTPL